MADTGLLVVDFQNGIVKYGPYMFERTLDTVKHLIQIFRSKNLPVMYVRHTEGNEEFLEGSDDWQIDPRIAPLDGDFVFNKSHSSSFKETQLKAHLTKLGIQTLVLCGMQTEYCIDTTAKAGFEHGYNIIIADGGHTTFENSVLSAEQMYVHYNKIIFNDSFSKVLTLNQIQAFLDQR